MGDFAFCFTLEEVFLLFVVLGSEGAFGSTTFLGLPLGRFCFGGALGSTFFRGRPGDLGIVLFTSVCEEFSTDGCTNKSSGGFSSNS